MSAAFSPAPSSARRHWRVYESVPGVTSLVSLQVPFAAVSVCPAWWVPVTLGSTVFAGGSLRGLTVTFTVIVSVPP